MQVECPQTCSIIRFICSYSTKGIQMASPDLDRHISLTYRNLRVGMGVLAVAFPLLLWWIGLVCSVELQRSISAYYHTSMRDVFVGVLFAVGAYLYLYKGFS